MRQLVYLSNVIDVLRVMGRILPRSIKVRIGSLFSRIENYRYNRVGKVVLALKDFTPFGAADEFASEKIVQVNNALAWGGVERQIVTLLRALEQRGYPADLLCLRLGESADNEFYRPVLEGYPGTIQNVMGFREAEQIVRSLPRDQANRMKKALRWLPVDVQRDIIRFAAQFMITRPHAVHAWQDSTSLVAGYAAQIVGVPRIIVSSRNLNPTNFGYFRPYMREAYRQLSACSSIRMVNNSHAGAIDYAAWLGIEPNRFEIHRNGVDPSVFTKAGQDRIRALRTELKIPDAARVIGSLFRFYPEKEPLLWAEMARLVADQRPDVHFVVFGVGPMKDEVQEFARKYGFAERMHLPGTIQASNLAMGLYDIFVLTSRFEGTPNVIIEASMLGVPVVTTAAGGAVEAVEPEKTGLVEYEWNAEKIASKVLAILDDPAWSARARSRGPMFIAERFGLDRMVDEAMSYYGLSPDKKPS